MGDEAGAHAEHTGSRREGPAAARSDGERSDRGAGPAASPKDQTRGLREMTVRVEMNASPSGLVGAPLNRYRIAARWRRWTALGGLTILLGLASITLPWLSGMRVETLLGGVLIGDGLLQGVHAAQIRRYQGAGWRVAGALVSLAAGSLLLGLPPQGMITLALLLGSFLLAAGIIKAFLATVLQPLFGWGWLLADGVMSALLGLVMLLLLPQAADWFIGFLLGASLVFDGIWLIGTALTARQRAAETRS